VPGLFTDIIGWDGFEAYFAGVGLFKESIRFRGKVSLTLPIGPKDEVTGLRKPLAYFDLQRLDLTTTDKTLVVSSSV
jgi:hypothetical protein